MLGDRMAGIVAQLGIGEHGRVERFLLGGGMGIDLDVELLEQARAVAVAVRDPLQQAAVEVVVLLEVAIDAGFEHVCLLLPSNPQTCAAFHAANNSSCRAGGRSRAPRSARSVSAVGRQS